MRSSYEEKLTESDRLERFLCWLLDARWFPTNNGGIEKAKKEARARLRTLRAIIRRMETFVRRTQQDQLQHSLAEWKTYANTLQDICATTIRRSPTMQTGSRRKRETVIAERLLCAALVIPKLWSDGSTYSKMKELLEDPGKLKYDTASQSYINLCQHHQGQYCIQLVRYGRSEKALQSLVQRLRTNIRHRHSPYRDDLEVLHHVYGQYCWQSLGTSGFTDSEAHMLASLVNSGTEHRTAKQNRGIRDQH